MTEREIPDATADDLEIFDDLAKLYDEYSIVVGAGPNRFDRALICTTIRLAAHYKREAERAEARGFKAGLEGALDELFMLDLHGRECECDVCDFCANAKREIRSRIEGAQ